MFALTLLLRRVCCVYCVENKIRNDLVCVELQGSASIKRAHQNNFQYYVIKNEVNTLFLLVRSPAPYMFIRIVLNRLTYARFRLIVLENISNDYKHIVFVSTEQ